MSLVRSAIFLVFLATFPAYPQIAISFVNVSPEPHISVRSFRDTAPARISPVNSSPDVTFALASEFGTPDQIDQLKTFVQDQFVATKGAKAIRLLTIRGSKTDSLGPFSQRAKLRQALSTIRPSELLTENRLTAEQFYSSLISSLPSQTETWTNLVVAGALPALAPELHEYASALLLNQALKAKVRFHYLQVGTAEVPFLRSVATYTSGSELSSGTTPDANGFSLVEWNVARLARGFHLHRLELSGLPGLDMASIPFLAVAENFPLPDLSGYRELRIHVIAAKRLLDAKPFGQDQANAVRAELQAAFLLNPMDEEALAVGAELYARGGDHAQSAAFLELASQLRPSDPGLFARIGRERFLAGDSEPAEKAIVRARELGWKSAESAEELARVHLARKDLDGALSFLDESLGLQSDNQKLWFLRADVFNKKNDWLHEAESLERAIALGGNVLERRAYLTEMLLNHDQKSRAAAQVNAAVKALPPDAGTYSIWARNLERLDWDEQALKLWQQTVKLDPKLEAAHYSVASLLWKRKEFEATLSASEQGLRFAPRSARLVVLKASALEALGRIKDARQTVRQASTQVDGSDASLLKKAALFEDLYGASAPEAYQKWAQFSPDLSVLSRGLKVSVRDSDLPRSAWFAGKLKEAGTSEDSLISDRAVAEPSQIPIPGGTEALAFIARGKAKSDRDHFLVDYARTVFSQTGASPKLNQEYSATIHDYFQRLSTLLAFGSTPAVRGSTSLGGKTTTITLSLRDKQSQKLTERVMDVLGWKLRTVKGQVTIESGEKGSQAKKQDLASALAIDQIAMQSAFAARKPFEINILWDSVPAILPESSWRDQFFSKEPVFGGLVEAMAANPNVAKLYVGLGAISPSTARALVDAFGLRNLAEKQGSRMLLFAPCLAVEQSRVSVPGGRAAEPVWKKLTGADPAAPTQFFRALFQNGDGALLAFYSMLGELDSVHQTFFTANSPRASRFLDLFRQLPDAQREFTNQTIASPFSDFLREVPVNTDGSVDFPGSPEIWMVAKGKSDTGEKSAKLLKKAHRKVAPDEEDAILIRLAATRYKTSKTQASELDNFIAVVRIEAHRRDPMDEQSALLLAQNYSQYKDFYPYFALLTDLNGQDFQRFFSLCTRFRSMKPLESSAYVGEFSSLLEIIRLRLLSGNLSGTTATEAFRDICQSFETVSTPERLSKAVLVQVEKLTNNAADTDLALRSILLGPSRIAEWNFDDGVRSVDISIVREKEYARVLDQQKVPSLNALLSLARAARNLGKELSARNALQSALKQLPSVEISKDLKFEGEARQMIRQYSLEKLQRLAATAMQKTAPGKKLNSKDLEKLEGEILAELEPQIRLALAGNVYAFYFRPSDLAVADDPLFLRKHEWSTSNQGTHGAVFAAARMEHGTAGSHITGSFADFPSAVARVATSGKSSGAEAELTIAQLASVRSTHWSAFNDDQLRLFGLRVRAAREWIVESAERPSLRARLETQTLGLLSASRRRDLFDSLDRRDWKSVWNSLSLSDLHALAGSVPLKTMREFSPVVEALDDLQKQLGDGKLDALGANLTEIYACSHPHLAILPPYEVYERSLFASRMAERSSEMKLYLAEYLERSGIPASFLPALAEPVAMKLLGSVQMSDGHDWKAALAAFAKLNDNIIHGVLAAR